MIRAMPETEIPPAMRGDIYLFIKRGIDEVKVLLIHLFFGESQSFAEALEVYDLPLTQEFDDVVHVRVV